MAKSVETILRDYVGDQVLTLAKMSAEVERLQEAVSKLEAELETLRPAGLKPNGRPPAPSPVGAPGAVRS